MAPVRVLRVSYTGELSYELHHPVEYQSHLYELISDAGSSYNCVDFGYRALDSLRLEMGYRSWDSDLSSLRSPFEAGLGRYVRLDKGDFLGRSALLRQLEAGPEVGLAALVVDGVDADCHGHEPVFSGETLIGSIECGGFGHTLGVSLAYGYLPTAYLAPGTQVEVSILGERRPAVVTTQPPLRAAARLLRAIKAR
jgi:dimethylglycine dehydrogenase